MNLIEDCRYDVKGSSCWPLLTVIVLLWLRTIFVVLLAAILHVNVKGENGRRVGSISTVCRELCKTAEPIEMPFGIWTLVGRR